MPAIRDHPRHAFRAGHDLWHDLSTILPPEKIRRANSGAFLRAISFRARETTGIKEPLFREWMSPAGGRFLMREIGFLSLR